MSEEAVAEVRRHLPAPPERVFDAFADAQIVSRWLSPSPEIPLTILRFEFRVGGIYRFAYRIPDGRTMTVNGVYRSIVPPSMIAFSWNIEPPDEHAGLQSEVMVSITPDAAGAELVIRHTQLTQPGAAQRHAEGWRGAVARLAGLLADDRLGERSME